MTDYRPLLARAISSLDPSTGEARRAVYDRARAALVNQLRGINPPLAESEITKERLALEEAIRKIEGEAANPPPPPVARPEPVTPPPPAPPPSSRAPAAPPPRDRAPANNGRGAGELHIPADRDPFEPDAPPPGRGDGPRMAREPREPREPRDPRDPREPREPRGGNGREPQPRGRGAQEPGHTQLRPRPGRGKSPAEYAREDARRATKTRLVVVGIVGVLVLLALTVGYVHRDRILTLAGIGEPVTQTTENDPTKTPDRLPAQDQQTQNQQAPQPAPPTTPAIGDGQRAVLFEENPGGQQVTNFVGKTTWRTETINPGPGRAPDVGIRIDVEIPERKLTAVITIRRNPDQSLPASHYIELQFNMANDAFGGIAQVPAIRAKSNESAQGIALAGLSVRVMQGFFLIGLSAIDADRDRNIGLLKSQAWIDIPFVYNNGRRAVLAFEKGPAGEKAVQEAFAAWGN